MGAWIETSKGSRVDWLGAVAPYVGAWIETDEVGSRQGNVKSHPMWVRGLKPHGR